MADLVIETKELSKTYKRDEVVKDLSLSVPKGSIYAFVGPNGAGKTTTIKMIMNLIRPTSGSAVILGTPSNKLKPAQLQRIGYVSENQELPLRMTVQQLLDYCRPLYPDWDDAFCEELKQQFDLPLNRKLRQMSRGDRIKAALLSSLAYRPELLVLDEPFSGAGPTGQRRPFPGHTGNQPHG